MRNPEGANPKRGDSQLEEAGCRYRRLEVDLTADLDRPATEYVGRSQERVRADRCERRVEGVHVVRVQEIVDVQVAAEPIPSHPDRLRKARVDLVKTIEEHRSRLDER